jgi:DNA-binding Xre family transcriptional regulator
MRDERHRQIRHHWIQDVVKDNLQEAMKKDGRSAEDLAQAAKVSRKSVERLRDGKNSTLTTLGAVADQLGIEPVDLLRVRFRTARTPLVSANAAEQQPVPRPRLRRRN